MLWHIFLKSFENKIKRGRMSIIETIQKFVQSDAIEAGLR
jgi:hypothetical protein